MAGASARRKTQQFDLQAMHPNEVSETHEELPPLVASVARLRIVPVGRTTAARSGGTMKIGGTVMPLHTPGSREERAWQPPPPPPQPRRVVRDRSARVVRETPVSAVDALASEETMEPARQLQIDMMRMRAANMLSGLQDGLDAKRQAIGNWKKPSTRVLCIAVAAYAFALFLFAVFGG